MNVDPADLLVRVRGRASGAGPYPVEAELSDGSRFTGGSLTIDPGVPVPDGQDEAYGRHLFEALFSGPIRTAYDQALAAAVTAGGLRIRLQIDPDAVELEGIRWERLYRERNGAWIPLATAGDTPFSRYLAAPDAEPRPVATLPLRILLAVSNPEVLPPGFQPVEVRREVETFHQALGSAAATDDVDVTILARRADLGEDLCARLDADGFTIVDSRTTLTELIRHLSGSHIVHFVGHGAYADDPAAAEREVALFFERDEPGRFDPVTGAQLVTRFAATDAGPSLVYLSACESGLSDGRGPHPFLGIAPRLIGAGVAAVVAMQDRIPVKAARAVTGDFYGKLFATGLVDEALNQARAVLFDEQARDWTIPILFTRLHRGRLLVEHSLANRVISDDVVLTPEPEHGVVADRVPSVPVPRLRPAPVFLLPRDFPDLLGREDEVRQTLADLAGGSMVEFYGPPGSGKTVLLRNVSNRAGSATGASVVHVPDGGEPVEDLLQFLFDALYEADASLRPTDADLRRYLAACRTVVAVDDADVSRDALGQLIELVPNGRFVLAAMTQNLWGEGRAVELRGLRSDAAVALFERGLRRPLTTDERPAAEALCAALGGVPLSILQAADQVAKGTLPLPPPPPPPPAASPAAAPASPPVPPAPPAVPAPAGAPPALPAVPATSVQAGAIDGLTDEERTALAVIAAAGAPIGPEHVAAVTGRPDAATTCESLRRAGLVRTASPRYALAQPLPPGYEATIGVAGWRPRLVDHLVRWVDQNRRSPGVLVRDLDLVLAVLDSVDDAADPARVLELARAAEAALILSKRWTRWERLLDREAAVATATNDAAALAWARHEQGTRALALQDEDLARASLREALAIREGLHDIAGAAVTRHNLELLGPIPPPTGHDEPPKPPKPDPTPRPAWLRPPLVLAIAGVVLIGGVLGAKAAVDWVRSQTAEVPGNFVPVARFAPDRLDLGTVEIGGSSQATLTVSNVGNADLVVSRIALDPPVDDLSISNDCPEAIPAEASCDIIVTFEPTAAGDRGTSVTVEDNTAEGSHAIEVTARGSAPAGVPAVEIKPQAVDFGVVPRGGEARQEIVVASSGTGDVEISEVVPPDGGGFALVRDDCSGQTLPPGSTCSFEVAFAPSEPGDVTATVAILDSTPDARHEISLAGAGQRGLADLVAGIDTIGEPSRQEDGTIAVPIIVIVRNDGDAAAGTFSILGEYLDPQIDREQVLRAGLSPDPDFPVAPDGSGAVVTTEPIGPGSALKFTGRLSLPADTSGRTLQLFVEADSCLGQETFDQFVIDHCRIVESDETNNRSNVIETTMPFFVDRFQLRVRPSDRLAPTEGGPP